MLTKIYFLHGLSAHYQALMARLKNGMSKYGNFDEYHRTTTKQEILLTKLHVVFRFYHHAHSPQLPHEKSILQETIVSPHVK